MGQGFKVYSSSELYCKWPKVAETMTEAQKRSMSEPNKYLSGLKAYTGFKPVGIPVRPDGDR
jgi:hypothetical protein